MQPTYVCAAMVLVLSASSYVSAGIIVRDLSDNTIANSIRNLDINGTLFDIDFSRAGEEFNDVFGKDDFTGNPSLRTPFFYDDLLGARAARDAIADLLEASDIMRVGDSLASSNFVDVGTRLDSVESDRFVTTVYFDLDNGRRETFNLSRSGSTNAGFALFTEVNPVPEPSSVAVWGMGLAGLAGMAFVRRRRRR